MVQDFGDGLYPALEKLVEFGELRRFVTSHDRRSLRPTRSTQRAVCRPLHPETLSGLFAIILAQGVHPKVVSEQLGHATIALTLDTYSHVIPSLQQEAAGVIAAAILDPASMQPQSTPKGHVRAITSGG